VIDRRTILSTVPMALLAGCPSGGAPETLTKTATMTPTAAETAAIDLREANVTAVALDGAPGTDARFHVTLYPDDVGEDGFANWWQVEAVDRSRLGRHELFHAHGTTPFTRSTTIAMPEEQECVFIPGHDQTHDYGGRAVLGNLRTGATKGVLQGPGCINLHHDEPSMATQRYRRSA